MDRFKQDSGSGASVEQLLRMGIETAKQGNKQGARVLLQQVIQEDKRNDRAWMWMAYVENDPVQRRRYLENAVRINPSNDSAKKALAKMNRSQESDQNKTLVYGGLVLAGVLVLTILACIIVLALN